MSPPPEPKGVVVVSVIVPAYNAEKWLIPALQSACAQTLGDIEILVVDDGSSDGTVALVEAMSAKDSRIRLIRQKNAGVGAARNTAIREARGMFLAPLDADDVWYPDKLELQVRAMEEGGAETGLVYCWSEKIDGAGRRITGSFPFEIEGRVVRSLVLRNFIGNASSPMFRAEAVRKVGPYLTREEQGGVQGCEDWDLSIRIAGQYRVGVVRKTLVGYRQVEECMSLNVDGMTRSYQIAMEGARSRNPALPARIFRWSAGNFHSYLVSKCYLWGNYGGCLRSVVRTLAADPVLATNHRLYLMGLKSLIRLATGTKGRLPGAPPGPTGQARPPRAKSLRATFSEGIQNRRWQRVLDEDSCSMRL